MSGSGPIGNTATLNLILGLFLKLLGFFIVLYGFTEIDPVKARQAEISLQERFNISVSLIPAFEGISRVIQAPVQTRGRSYVAIEKELKTQIDFMSTRYTAHNDSLVLRVPADVALPLAGRPAKSPDFAAILSRTLMTERPANVHYALEIVTIGSDDDALIRAVSLFVQKMIAENYPPHLLTIGHQPASGSTLIELRLKQVQS